MHFARILVNRANKARKLRNGVDLKLITDIGLDVSFLLAALDTQQLESQGPRNASRA